MARPATSAALIGEIYDAALDPAGLTDLTAVFARAFDGASAAIALAHADGRIEASTHALPPDAPIRYAAYYRAVNPFLAVALAKGPDSRVRSALEYVPELQLKQTEFYCDFARPLGTFEIIGGVLPIAPDCIADLGVHRGERDRRYDQREVQRMSRMLPHFQSALRLRRRLGQRREWLGLAALEALAIGCVICDSAARTLYANTAAETLAAEAGLRLATRDALRADRPEDSRRLLTLVADVASGGPGGALALVRDGSARLFLLVAPLAPQFGLAPGHALITMRNADATTALDPRALHDIFGLTPAEARLALALLAGRSLTDFEAERGITENTARTQLAAVLRKTETSGQRDLVRLLAAMPPLRSGRLG